MANEFIIKKGHSSRLASIPQSQLIENGWYLTTDTAEIYVALRSDSQNPSSELILKKLNECNIDIDFDIESFETRLEALEKDRTHVFGYRVLFPAKGEKDHFYIAEDEHRTYVYADNRYIHIADKFDTEDDDNDPETLEVRIIFGGSAE